MVSIEAPSNHFACHPCCCGHYHCSCRNTEQEISAVVLVSCGEELGICALYGIESAFSRLYIGVASQILQTEFENNTRTQFHV